MSDIRRIKMQKLVDGFASQNDAAISSGVTPGWLSDVLMGRRNIGERLARRIEQRNGLAPGWLDRDSTRRPTVPKLDLVVNGKVVGTFPVGTMVSLRLRSD